MNINFNLQAMIAQRALKNSENKLSASTERLSSGYKINHAKDDAAGLAISKKMRIQIRGLEEAGNNADNGISVCETADGALAEIEEMLQRMNELTIKAANGTCTTTDRMAMEEESVQLRQEIERIATQTDFNGATLLDGTFDLRGYSDTLGVDVKDYTDEMPVGKYTIKILQLGDETTEPVTDASVELLSANAGSGADQFVRDAIVTADGNSVTITDTKGKTISLKLDPDLVSAGDEAVLDITGIGAFTVQVGANEGQILDMRIPEVSLERLGIENLDLTTEASAKKGIDMIGSAIDEVSAIRARLGAYQNRLEHTSASLDVTHENMTAAESRIMDLDMSEEMVDYTTYQVLVQAGTSKLSQANSQPEQALQLLQ